MTRSDLPMRILTAVGVGAAALLWNGNPALDGPSFVSKTEARIGRPMTPMSYSGVARRTTRRAAAVGAAAAASSCVQVVDSYGRISTVCGY